MSLAQVRKAVVSLIVLGCAAAALFITVSPNFVQAVVTLAGAGFGVVAVYMAKNHTIDDLSKAVAQLQASALSVVGFFIVVPTSTVGKVSLIVGALVSAYAVFFVPNESA